MTESAPGLCLLLLLVLSLSVQHVLSLAVSVTLHGWPKAIVLGGHTGAGCRGIACVCVCVPVGGCTARAASRACGCRARSCVLPGWRVRLLPTAQSDRTATAHTDTHTHTYIQVRAVSSCRVGFLLI